MSCNSRVLTPVAVATMLAGAASPALTQHIAERELPKPTATLKDGLKSARYVRPLPDGRVLVYDEDARKIVVADLALGKSETRMSAGDEDGEFLSPGPLWAWPGDTIVSLDAGKSRLMFFGADGKLARTLHLEPPTPTATRSQSSGPPRGPGLPNVRALFGTDMVIGTAARVPPRPLTPPAPTAAPMRVPYTVLRVSLRTLRPDSVVTLMPPQAPRTTPSDVRGLNGNLPIYVSTAPLQSVDAWAALSDGTVAVVRAASYRIEWFTPAGEHTFTDAVPFTPIPVTREDQKRVVDDYRRIGEQVLKNHPQRTGILVATYEEPQSWPATHPPFRGDVPPQVDPQDRIWLLTRCSKDEQATCYDVIDRGGARVERYRLPAKTRIVGFGLGVVYTAFEQKSDKSVLQRHPLK